ncbi:MAG: adenosylcobinamide-GDP ribazoletransferase [Bryobacterales bacterium]|jgi:adenosylcobinamide-GDP ribazoletransferase|nr:adenosylcobinamide-GDP ribazoletransferase [Bryobacterales bacterium]
MRSLLGAVQFLTVIPVRGATAPPGASAPWFPLVGVALGAGAGAVVLAIPGPLGAAVALVLLTAATGGLHEDGLADVADAVRAGRTPERIHDILKDSRVGAYGVLAIVFSILVRWQALSLVAAPVPALAAAAALSRATMVGLAWTAPPAGDGLGAAFIATLRLPGIALMLGAAAAALAGPSAIFLIAFNALLVAAARAWFVRRLGGVTGDCLGATAQVSECLSLVVLACELST